MSRFKIDRDFLLRLQQQAPLAIAFAIPFPIRFFMWICILIIAGQIFCHIHGQRFDTFFRRDRFFLLLFLQFLILCLGLVHTNDLQSGLGEIERSVFMVAFPVVAWQWRTLEIKVWRICQAFITGLLAVTVICVIRVTLDGPEAINSALSHGHSYFTGIFIHPAYLSMYFVFGFAMTLDRAIKSREPAKRFLLWSLLVIQFFMIFFLRSRMSIFVFILILPVLVLSFIKMKSLLISAGVIAITFFLVIQKNEQWLESKIRFPRNAVMERVESWRATIEGYKISPLWGAGTGSEQTLIDEGYIQTGYDTGLDNAYNAHNQYLQFLIRNGPLELLVFLLFLGLLLKKAVRKRSIKIGLFCLVFCLSLLTESMLNVQKGIVFFYFFSCAFYLFSDD
jgi:O-antigen ligase